MKDINCLLDHGNNPCVYCKFIPCQHDDSSWCSDDCLSPRKLIPKLKAENEGLMEALRRAHASTELTEEIVRLRAEREKLVTELNEAIRLLNNWINGHLLPLECNDCNEETKEFISRINQDKNELAPFSGHTADCVGVINNQQHICTCDFARKTNF